MDGLKVMQRDVIQRRYDRLVLAAALLALVAVVLGAYVRLSDAGLGCPDWPGCYGHLTVPHSEAAQQAYPAKPLEAHKAWKEMVHRYFAGTLGLLIAAICFTAWRGRGRLAASPAVPTLLLALVAFQAVLGMWTVTLLLKPAIVSLHLLGGMATLALLVWLASSRWLASTPDSLQLAPWAMLGLAVLGCQIALGGWTSSNYAALACTDFPSCHEAWWPSMDFPSAFHLARELGMNTDGSRLSMDALTAIHVTHRIGALAVFIYLGWLGSRLLHAPGLRPLGIGLLGLLLVQIGLGVSNVVFSLPLPIAVAHNAGAALLLAALVVINSKLLRGGSP
ncbi:MAG TPA: COX15/CtaA family protein [Novimethylophilus sp.]|jgi:cytochrome c oxidase assembly protein subunit 15|uniref:COX15/CtaA family protein n=1 Tax=Novimethylophilus sp. TaxID=2137426 RepID=UPI002F404724